MKLKDSELKNILKEVEQEFQTMLKSEQADLKKAAGDDDKPDEAGSASSGGDASAPAPEASSAPAEASAPAEGSAPEASASAPAEASAAPDASAAPGDPAAQAAPADPEALKAEYSKLDPESLKAHYMAAKAALFELMGASGEASPEASASAPPMAPPAPGPEASASAAPPAAPPPAMKAEVPASIKNIPATADMSDAGGKGGKGALHDVKALGKSEAEVAKDQKIGDLEKQVELLAKAVELSLGTPMRKAITSVAHIAKTEEAPPAKAELTKSEVQEKIKKAMGSGKLTKSQKDTLFSYTLGNTEFDKIKDLLA